MTKELIHYQGTVYEPHENAMVRAYRPCKNVMDTTPHYAWLGAKIPAALFQQMISFCRWSQKEFKSEALLYLFYDVKTQVWDAWAPPQETAGMTVKSRTEHPSWNEQRKLFAGKQMMGTLHHHCNIKAFASATDETDEQGKNGVHFTLGHMDLDILDLHCRATFYGIQYECDLLDWVERPLDYEEPTLPDMLDIDTVWDAIDNGIAESILSYDEEDDFPEFWKTNITKKKTYGELMAEKSKIAINPLYEFDCGEENPDFINTIKGQHILKLMIPKLEALWKLYFKDNPFYEYPPIVKELFEAELEAQDLCIELDNMLTVTEIECLNAYTELFDEFDIAYLDYEDFLWEGVVTK